jgi:hypothetical protein
MNYSEYKEEASFAETILRWGLMAMVILGILVGLGGYMGFISFSFWAPKMEQVRYDTFKESQSYNEGMIRDLQNLKIEYFRANSDQKEALKAIILHRFSVYDVNKLPDDLQVFYLTVKGV